MKLNRRRRLAAAQYMALLRTAEDMSGRERFAAYREFYKMLVDEQEEEDERTTGNLLARMRARHKRA